MLVTFSSEHGEGVGGGISISASGMEMDFKEGGVEMKVLWCW